MVQKSKVFLYVHKSEREPQLTDFELTEEELDPVKEGEFIAEALYIGVIAGLRTYQEIYPVGSIVVGGQVARVTESKTEDFPVGSIVFGMFGWRTHTNVNPANFPSNNLYVMPDLGDLPVSLGVGYLSTTGNTAYFGVQEICQLKEGEIFAVTAAAGSVGTLAGQIAKIKGCKVIGFAGSDEKCQRLEGELGFDKAINYKKDDIDKALKEAAPEGIDCFFDNVGGQLAVEIMPHMKMYGRIATCGALSEYITQEETKIRSPSREFILKQLSIQGFMFYRWVDRWQEGIQQTLAWIKEGKIKYCETITEGFENLPQAFIDVLHGKNFGKAVVKVQ